MNLSLKVGLLSLAVLLSSEWSRAAEMKYRSCLLGLANQINKWETGAQDKLSIMEFHFQGSAAPFFKDHALTMAPLPLTKEAVTIWRRTGVARGIQKLFRESRLVDNLPSSELPKMLQPNVRYTYVIHDDKIVFAQTAPGNVRNIGSKHNVLRDQNEPLRMAGEFWVDEAGKFHVDGASGTFTPKNSDVDNGVAFFRDHLGITNIEGHHYVPPAPVQKSVNQIAYNLYKHVSRPFSATRVTYTIANSARLKQMESMDGSVIEVDGKKYQVLKANAGVAREVIYDTDKFELTAKGSEFRSASVDLDTSSAAARLARQRLPAGSLLKPQANEETALTEYGLYPMSNGVVDLTNPALFIDLEKSTRTGIGSNLAGKSITSYSAEVEGDPSLAKALEQSFQLQEGTVRDQRVIEELRSYKSVLSPTRTP